MFNLKKIKDLFSGFKKSQTGTSGDILDTATRSAVSGIIKEVIEMLPKKYFRGMSKNRARLVSLTAVLTGYILRKMTPFGPFGDNVITDMAQEVSDQIMAEYKEEGAKTVDPVKAKAEFNQRKTKLMYIAKVFINAARYANDLSAEKLLSEFNDLMSELPEENQYELIETLSGFDKNQLIDFMKCSKEQKKLFFSHLFTKIPEKKEEPPHGFDGLKEWFNDAKKSLDGVLLKTESFIQQLETKCAPEGSIGKSAKSFRERAQEFYNQTKTKERTK